MNVIELACEVWRAGDMYIGPPEDQLKRFARLIRNAALEEAAVVCIETGSIKGSCDAEFDMVDACAAAIRQLKDKS